MHRRKFLTMLGIGGVSATLCPGVPGGAMGAASAQAATQEFKGHPEAFGVLHDTTRCIGCRKCEAGCAKRNNLPTPEKPFDDLSVLDKKRRTDFKSFTVVNKYMPDGAKSPVFRKQQCNHCQEPACASACFVKAFTKNQDGTVTYDASLCVGCRYCMISCPFYVPTYDYNNPWNPLVYKCTMCAPFIREGKLPGCVEACPREALTFGKRSDLLHTAWKRIRENKGSYVEHVYGEHEMGGTNWLYISAQSFNELGMPVTSTKSVPELTSGFLGSTPVAAVGIPVVLTGVYAANKLKEKNARVEKEEAIKEALEKAGQEAKASLDAALAKAAKEKDAALAKEAQKLKALEEKVEMLEEKEAASKVNPLEDTLQKDQASSVSNNQSDIKPDSQTNSEEDA